MKIELVDLTEFSGDKAHVYSIVVDDAESTLFDQFVEENALSFQDEMKDIVMRLKNMGDKTGCPEHFFKLYEGGPGDGVAALWANRLRLYCIRYGSSLIILGDGGYKSPEIRSYQEDSILNEKVALLKRIARLINERIRERDIKLNEDGTISGELIIDDYEEN